MTSRPYRRGKDLVAAVFNFDNGGPQWAGVVKNCPKLSDVNMDDPMYANVF